MSAYHNTVSLFFSRPNNSYCTNLISPQRRPKGHRVRVIVRQERYALRARRLCGEYSPNFATENSALREQNIQKTRSNNLRKVLKINVRSKKTEDCLTYSLPRLILSGSTRVTYSSSGFSDCPRSAASSRYFIDARSVIPGRILRISS